MPEATIFLVDDEADLRKALSRLLRAEGFNVLAFGSAEEFLAARLPTGPGCLLLDVSMPGLDGLALQHHLAQTGAVLPIIFLTGHGDIPMSVRAIKAGATDFFTKPVNDADLLRAVRAALEKSAGQQADLTETAGLRERVAQLTPREYEVFTHVLTGKLNKQIGGDLGISEHTIKIHRGRVMEKLACQSVADLIRVAQKLGIPPAA